MNYDNEDDDLWGDFEAASTDSYESIWYESESYYENCLRLIKRTLYPSSLYRFSQRSGELRAYSVPVR
jgi:hypothetical protein